MNHKCRRYPVIGIRPIIDARMGILDVRSSLEEQTMSMARAAKSLLEKELRYSDGKAVKVIIASHSIGRSVESANCEQEFRDAGVDITLSVTPCWCYGSETMDMNPMTIKAVWGLNATERPGAVYLSAVLAAYARKGLPAFGIYGKDVQEADDEEIPDDVREKLLRFGRAAIAAASLRGGGYLQIGSVCMGIAGSSVDSDFFEEYLGMRVESIDEVEVLRRIKLNIFNQEEYQKALIWVRTNCREGIDKNPVFAQHTEEEKEKNWEFSVKCALIIKDLMAGNETLSDNYPEEALGFNAIAAGFQGQRQWTDFLPNTDFAEAILNTSFDWNGRKEPMILATENDSLNAVSMLLLKLISNKAQMFADVRTFWSQGALERVSGYQLEGHAKEAGGIIHLINSGACCLDACGKMKNEAGEACIKNFWEIEEKDIKNCLEATVWCEADLGYFRGGGYSSRFVTEAEMPMTMVRINIVKGLGPVAQVVEGWSVQLPEEVTDILWKRTDYTWPCTWFAPRAASQHAVSDAYHIMKNWGANHAAISYGHIGADVLTLCSMLRIPVCLHNIDEAEIFRPACWQAFGMDAEAQDFRACANFGPLYR